MSPFQKLSEEFLTEEEVAKLLQITVRTLRNRRYTGKDHPPYIRSGTGAIFRVKALTRWLEEREQKEIA